MPTPVSQVQWLSAISEEDLPLLRQHIEDIKDDPSEDVSCAFAIGLCLRLEKMGPLRLFLESGHCDPNNIREEKPFSREGRPFSHDVIFLGTGEALVEFLDYPTDFELTDDKGRTLLQQVLMAMCLNNIQTLAPVACRLIDEGASLETADRDGFSPRSTVARMRADPIFPGFVEHLDRIKKFMDAKDIAAITPPRSTPNSNRRI